METLMSYLRYLSKNMISITAISNKNNPILFAELLS